MASLEVDLTKIEPGNTITVKWRGKPVFIRRRTEEDIEQANSVDLKTLRDPQEDKERVQNPEVSPVLHSAWLQNKTPLSLTPPL